MMGLSHSLKDGKYQADITIQMADDLLPPEISAKVKNVAEKCRNAGDGFDNDCETAFALTKCAYAADSEGKPQKKPQPGNLSRPGFEPGPPGFAARRADRYSTGVGVNDDDHHHHHYDEVDDDDDDDDICWVVVYNMCSVNDNDQHEFGRLSCVGHSRCDVQRNICRKVFENKVLRKIFGAKRNEVTGERRKLYNTELHALYSSPDIIRNIKSRRLRWAGHVARMGESRNAYRVLVVRPEGKRLLERPRRRWEDNIKMDLREVGYDGRDWINLAQDRDQWRAYVRAAMNLRELTLDEIEKANMVLRKHCQPTSGVTDEVLDASMKGNFADDRGLKLKNKQFRADLAIRLADDILPANIKDRARAVVEKCRTAADGLTDECEMAFAIKKCAYQADP
ncbi:hypothetical protein ANN_02785, partial [Periplaneta americana]